jgi:hypothetical protein
MKSVVAEKNAENHELKKRCRDGRPRANTE